MKYSCLAPPVSGGLARAVRRRAQRGLQALAGAIIILGGLPSLAAGATYYVDQKNTQCTDTGAGTQLQPFCTIGAAAARVVAGDTVRVQPGTYNEQVTVPKSGTASAPILFDAVGAVTVTGRNIGFDLSGRSWVTVQGFTVSRTTDDGIRALLSDNVTISGNQVMDAGAVGIEVRDCSNVTISNNDVQRSTGPGIFVKFCTNATVASNHVSRSGQPTSGLQKQGIVLNGSTNSVVSGNLTEWNTDHGIYLSNSSTGILVKGNTSHDNARKFARAATGMEIRSSSGNTIQGNITYHNEDSGINIRSSADNNLIVNNLSYDNGDHGIDHLGVTNSRIIGNTVYGNFRKGLEIEGSSSNITIANNIAVGNGLTTGSANIRTAANSVTGVTADYNLVFQSASGVMYTWADVNYASLAALKAANPSLEVHGLQADPRFVAPGSANFHLSAGSPAVDSANSGASGALATDLEGKSRFDDPGTPNTGAGPRLYDDRGAFELRTASPTNTPPQITSGTTATPNPLFSNQTATLSVTATDANGDALSYSWSVPAGGGSIQGTGSNVTYVPPTVAVQQTFTVSVQVSDGRGGTATGSVGVVVRPPVATNTPPQITSGPIAAPNPVPSNQTANLSVTATDANNDPLIYTWTVPPGGGSTSGTDPQVTYMPPAVTTTQVFTISVSVSDGKGGTATGAVDVTVLPASVGKLVSFRPVADAWVNESSLDQNYGGATKLYIDSKAVNTAFLRFTVTGLTAPVQDAWIELEVTSASVNGGTSRSVSDNTWGEFTVTYTNRPSFSTTVFDEIKGPVNVGDIVQLHVKPAITQNGTYSFAIVGGGSDGWAVRSREGSANTPMLFVATQ